MKINSKFVAVMMLVLVFLAGCATGELSVKKQSVLIDGKSVTYVAATVKDDTGLNVTCVDRYSEGKCYRDAFSGNGIAHSILNGVAGSAAMAGGMVGAAAVLRPDETNVIQQGGGASSKSSSYSDAYQTQGQTQTQKQGQVTRTDVVSVNTNVNSNTNTNSNMNANLNSNTNTNTLRGGGNTKIPHDNGNHGDN